MSINGFSAVSGSMGGFMPTSGTTQSVTPTGESLTIQGLPVDTIILGSKSLLTGMSISRQIMTSQKAIQAPNGEVTAVKHGNASILKTGKNELLLTGLVSTVRNLYDFMTGTITGTRVAGNVSADITGAVGGGILAAGAGSLVSSFIGSTMGAGIAGFLVGSATFLGTQLWYKNSGVSQSISDKVTKFIDDMLSRNPNPGGW